MRDREHPDAIDAAAARWVARLDRTPDDRDLAAAAAAWCEVDPRRRGAMLRAQAVWASIDPALAPDAAGAWRRPLLSRRRMLAAGGGLAAAVALFGMARIGLVHEDAVDTAVGERRTAALADGSTMVLNTASRTRVRITDGERQVSLDDGEAWFHVAKDRARPFVVSAGDVRVQAVGTAFAVRRLVDRAEVTVTEGRVRVWSVAAPARFISLDAGRHAVIADAVGAAGATVTAARPGETLAWRRGEIVLDGMTLGDAAAEFNRYNTRQLAVEAPLSERRIVGWFRTDDIDGFAKSAAAMTGARIERDERNLRIVE